VSYIVLDYNVFDRYQIFEWMCVNYKTFRNGNPN